MAARGASYTQEFKDSTIELILNSNQSILQTAV